jgi:hypothetical protein
LLPEGAKLVTSEEVVIGGVKAVKGIYTHPKFEDQRAIVAISDLESRKILPYPPLLRIEKKRGRQMDACRAHRARERRTEALN